MKNIFVTLVKTTFTKETFLNYQLKMDVVSQKNQMN